MTVGEFTFQVLVEDVLEAVEDRLVILDLPVLGGLRPGLPALEVGVDFAGVGRVLLVMCDLWDEGTQRQGRGFSMQANPLSELASRPHG